MRPLDHRNAEYKMVGGPMFRGPSDGQVGTVNGISPAYNGPPAAFAQHPPLTREYGDQWEWNDEDQDYVRLGRGMWTDNSASLKKEAKADKT
jgi:hypothetical protein